MTAFGEKHRTFISQTKKKITFQNISKFVPLFLSFHPNSLRKTVWQEKKVMKHKKELTSVEFEDHTALDYVCLQKLIMILVRKELIF